MKVTKATRWRVFAGVWLQSLFTSATAFFSLFCIPLTTQFGWSDSDFALAYTIYMFVYCAVGFIGGSLAEKLSPRITIYTWTMMRLCGSMSRWLPDMNSSAAMLAAVPMHTVRMGHVTARMAS